MSLSESELHSKCLTLHFLIFHLYWPRALRQMLWFAAILCPNLQDSFTCDWRGQQFLWMKGWLPSFWTTCSPDCLLTHSPSAPMARLLYHFFLHNRKHHPFYFTAPLFSLVLYFISSLWLFISSFPLLTVPNTAPSNLDTPRLNLWLWCIIIS